jgi:uncharacterized membrane protein
MPMLKSAFFAKLNHPITFFLLLLFVGCTSLSVLIPPFQSPDEFVHIQRAYLLSRGKIVLDHPPSESSGGMIDSGLAAYITKYRAFISAPNVKLSKDEITSAAEIRWSGTKEFSPAPGAAFYFPLIYAPQAVGLVVGKRLGLTVDSSYRLARAFSLATLILILFVAFAVYPTNPFALTLLILPMSLFQFASASLDGISTAMAVFSIAAFLRIATDRASAKPWLFYSLVVSVILLATSRVHLLPLSLLILVSCFYIGRRKESFAIFGVSLAAILLWLLIALKTTVDLRVNLGTPSASIISFYLGDPLLFAKVLARTIFNDEYFTAYRTSFIGILGWLDTPFTPRIYNWLTGWVVLVGLLSISFANIKTEWTPRLLLLVTSVASILLIFFALLVTWTVHPAQMINGVQGRYFLMPMMMIAYAVSGGVDLHAGILRKMALALVAILFSFVFVITTKLLVERYYLSLHAPAKLSSTFNLISRG